MIKLVVNEITVHKDLSKTSKFIFFIFLESVTEFDFFFPAVVIRTPAINFRILLLKKSTKLAHFLNLQGSFKTQFLSVSFRYTHCTRC